MGENGLIDRSGCTLKMEPLASVRQLERFLLKMVAKQWYDYERTSFNFIKKAGDTAPLLFNHHQDFDENGLIYWIGTNGKSAYDWVSFQFFFNFPRGFQLAMTLLGCSSLLPFLKNLHTILATKYHFSIFQEVSNFL